MPKSAEEIAKEALRSGLEHLRLNAFGSWESDLIEGVAAAIREDRAEPITEALNKFEDFINLPSEYEDSPGWRVRDYRHELWSKWTELRKALEAARKARAG